ncbi:hypothetical protein Hanom_Chr07g00629811 [Helianthus anomalus]
MHFFLRHHFLFGIIGSLSRRQVVWRVHHFLLEALLLQIHLSITEANRRHVFLIMCVEEKLVCYPLKVVEGSFIVKDGGF